MSANMKKTPLFLWLFLIFSISSTLSITTTNKNVQAVSGHCLKDQQSLLLQLKDSLVFDGSSVLEKWNQTTDCCSWEGVSCEEGRVTGLKLSNGSISDGIDENSALFDLVYLKSLDLSFNLDMNSEIPSRISNLTNLRYLNFSNAGFAGQVPKEMSRLTRLVTLDLSTRISWKYPVIQDLRFLAQNLTQLEELCLDRVHILAPKNEWGQTLSSSLPKLRVLSLPLCHLSGPIHPSLAKLKSLSVIRLDGNILNAPVPAFFSNFPNLTSLLLKGCGLYGTFPREIFQVQKLRNLDVSKNKLLHGSLPEFPSDRDIQSLILSFTNFSGILPTSVGNLWHLSRLELNDCHFSGTLPNSMTKLTQLVYLDLSDNNFTGPIPSFSMFKNLTHIDLSNNWLTGPISTTHWEDLSNLLEIYLHNNSLGGNIPSSLFSLPLLQIIDLSYNDFSGQILEIPNAGFSMLNTADLSNNNLQGPIPISIFKLNELKHLLLSSNNFSGTIQLDMIQGLANLVSLDLSYNSLSVNASGNGSNLSFLPKLSTLLLASCNLGIFPDLKNQSNLQFLDLSDNQISGEIPSWIWNVGNGSLISLNLSNNYVVGMQEPHSVPNQLDVLDLHSNQLKGKIPTLPSESFYIDLSNNGFTYSIPYDIGNNLSTTMFFSLSNNNLTGVIPKSICYAKALQVLDLSNNSLNGRIPTCIIAMNQIVGLNLRNNNLSGKVPDSFPVGCPLHTLDLNGNSLTGRFPTSLSRCKALQFIDAGNNQMLDTFPPSLKHISALRVVILRSNRFHGHITCGENIGAWPMIQIVDVASNNFRGELPGQCLTKWKAMTDTKTQLDHLSFEFSAFIPFPYYDNAVTVSNKGLQMELVKILTAFISIDFSSNKFHGKIPKELGQLKSLIALNLSHNVLSGQIPSSFGNLRQLESLDLSSNHLNGTIPQTLSGLNFLSFLNLSNNQLVGRIPSGSQFQTFSADGFEGNEGLCGPPLTANCADGKPPETSKEGGDSNSGGVEIERNLLSVEVGFLVGFGTAIWSLVFWKRWRNFYFNGAEDIAFSILPLQLKRKWLSWKMGKRKRHRIRGRRAV